MRQEERKGETEGRPGTDLAFTLAQVDVIVLVSLIVRVIVAVVLVVAVGVAVGVGVGVGSMSMARQVNVLGEAGGGLRDDASGSTRCS